MEGPGQLGPGEKTTESVIIVHFSERARKEGREEGTENSLNAVVIAHAAASFLLVIKTKEEP